MTTTAESAACLRSWRRARAASRTVRREVRHLPVFERRLTARMPARDRRKLVPPRYHEFDFDGPEMEWLLDWDLEDDERDWDDNTAEHLAANAATLRAALWEWR